MLEPLHVPCSERASVSSVGAVGSGCSWVILPGFGDVAYLVTSNDGLDYILFSCLILRNKTSS